MSLHLEGTEWGGAGKGSGGGEYWCLPFEREDTMREEEGSPAGALFGCLYIPPLSTEKRIGILALSSGWANLESGILPKLTTPTTGGGNANHKKHPSP